MMDINYHLDTTSGRVVNLKPLQYRLMQKRSGELVLQGLYAWNAEHDSGAEWADIPTEIEAKHDSLRALQNTNVEVHPHEEI